MKIEFDTEANVFWVPSDRYAGVLEGVAGRKYNRKLNRFDMPVEYATVLQIYGSCAPEFDEHGTLAVQAIADEHKWWTSSDVYQPNPDLLPHQNSDSDRFGIRGYGLNLSSRGTGKTRTMVHAVQEWPVLVVCPNIARDVWKQEFEADGKTVQVIDGNNTPNRKKFETDADVFVIGYPLIGKYSRLAKYGNRGLSEEDKTPGLANGRFKTVIADEAHRAANPDAKQARATWAVMHEAEARFPLTGTPISEDPTKIWPLLHMIRPDLFTSFVAFRERYALTQIGFNGYEEVIGIKPAMKQEYINLIKGYSLRHQLEEVAPNMPKTVYSEIRVEMAPKQRKAYEQMASEYKVILESGRIYADSAIAQRTRLLQFAAGLPVIEDGQIVALESPSCKVDALLQFLEDNDEPVVVFSDSRLLLDLASSTLETASFRVGVITGGVTEALRTSTVRQFQEGELDVILIQTSAGSEAITLTRASTTIFLGRPDSAKLGLQAEARVRRFGQLAEHVRVIDIITEDTIESSKQMMLSKKNETSYELLGDVHKEGR